MSCASRASGLLLSAFAAAFAACSQKGSTLVEDGTYLRQHVIAVNPLLLGRTDTLEWQPLPVTDCLRIESRGADAFLFDLVLVQSNFHSCSASGVASRRQGTSDFEIELETAEPEPCHLQLRFQTSEVVIEDVDNCRSIYCGAAAVLDARFDSESRRTPPVDCEEAPTPHIDTAQDLAEQLVEEWERRERETGSAGAPPE